MRLRIERVDATPQGWTTVGWWGWSEPNNHGTLTIQVSRMKSRRYMAAVMGHEILEAAYCKLFKITTEECDRWDQWVESEYASGSIPKTVEAGDIRACPYFWGHQLGIIWEYLCIYGTFASMRCYEAECNRIMGITS